MFGAVVSIQRLSHSFWAASLYSVISVLCHVLGAFFCFTALGDWVLFYLPLQILDKLFACKTSTSGHTIFLHGRNPPLMCDARIFSLWWWLRSSSAESSWGGCFKLTCVVTAVYVFLWASVVSSTVWRVARFHAEVRLVANLTVRTIFSIWT